MRKTTAVACICLLSAVSLFGFAKDEPQAERRYFKSRRSISNAQPGAHNFVVLDRWLWDVTREDLADIRLYVEAEPLPYVLRHEYGSGRREEVPAAMLNKVTVSGGTQFVLDIDPDQYDNVRFELESRDFVSAATVEGSESLEGEWKKIGTFTLYDFSKERLGSNSIIRFPTPLTFRYLKIVLPGIATGDINAASVANLQESRTRYVNIDPAFELETQGRESVYVWRSSGRFPVARLLFTIPGDKVNFSRAIHAKCDGQWLRNDEISRVRLNRRGRQIETEHLALALSGARCKELKVMVDNGDDPPIPGLTIAAQSVEARIYFKPASASGLWLYAGDEKLSTRPVYDYAKFFSTAEAEQAAQAALGQPEENPEHSPRPDDRPISERYPALIWAALIIAVASLGMWALKGFKKEEREPPGPRFS